MGVLAASGGMGGAGGGEPAPAAEPEGAPAPEPAEEGAAPPPAADAADAAPSDWQARRPESRRKRADDLVDEKISARLGDFEKRWATERQTYEAQLAAANQRAAMLEGRLHEIGNRPQPAPVPVRDDRPDPTDLRRQAKKALDDRDFETYERLRDEATLIDADRRAEERIGKIRTEIEQKIPQQLPPEVQVLMAQHRHVALAGQRGVQAVMLKDQELALYGHQPGHDRVAKAFELAEKMLAPRAAPARPAYSADAAAALSGVPAGRPPGAGAGGGGAEPEPLTAIEKQVARDAKMSEDDYRKWRNPDKFIKR